MSRYLHCNRTKGGKKCIQVSVTWPPFCTVGKKKKLKKKRKENPKDTTRKLLELFNESGKVAAYKNKTQKSLAFLYNNNERSEKEIKETIPFTITFKKTKIPRHKPT